MVCFLHLVDLLDGRYEALDRSAVPTRDAKRWCQRLCKTGSSALLMKHGRSDCMNFAHELQAPPPKTAASQAAAGCLTGLTGTGIRCKMRWRSRSNLARPSPRRLIRLTRQICPSHWPVLQAWSARR
jgi:hypothetical protein